MPVDYAEKHYLSKDGLKLYYREYGSGERTIVCLPGLTRNSKDFHDLAVHLASRYRVICPDFRGRGQSQRDPNWKNYNVITYNTDVQWLLDAAKVDSAIFIGTSLGGLVTMTLAYLAPQKIQAVVLNDVGPEIDPAGIARILSYAGRRTATKCWQEAAEQARANYSVAFENVPASFWEAFVRRSYRENSEGFPEPDVDPKVGDALRSASRAGKFLKVFNAIGLFRKIRGVPVDVWESFRAVTMPCLVLRGASSDILTEGIVEKMKAVNPGLVTVTIPHRGHAPLLDEPESLAAIDSFLESL